MPVAAVADTVDISAASFKIIAVADEVPANVLVPVNVCAVASDVSPVPATCAQLVESKLGSVVPPPVVFLR